MLKRRIGTALLLVASVALAACSAEEKKQDSPGGKTGSKVVSPGSTGSSGTSTGQGFVLDRASWGAVTEPRKQPPAPPRKISVKEGQREKFAREAARRWKNTEIFVRT